MRGETLALMKRGNEAFSNGDLDAIRAIAHEDDVWTRPGLADFEPRKVSRVTEYAAESKKAEAFWS